MTQDKRAEIVSAMARELLGRVNAPEQEIYRAAGDLADIALKAAAEIAKEIERQQENDCGHANTGGAQATYDAILALTSEGVERCMKSIFGEI